MTPDDREATLKRVGALLEKSFSDEDGRGPPTSFALLVFEVSGPMEGYIAGVSNADEREMAIALRHYLGRLEERIAARARGAH